MTIKEDVMYRCDNELLAKSFLKKVEELGATWLTGNRPTAYTHFEEARPYIYYCITRKLLEYNLSLFYRSDICETQEYPIIIYSNENSIDYYLGRRQCKSEI